MIGEKLKTALEAAERHEPPVLSLYLDVDPANPDNTGNAIELRAAAAMRGIGLEKDYIDLVTRTLSKHFVIPEGRTLVIYAGEDSSELFEAHYLQTRLPMLGRSDGALAHWGAPLTAPLHYVLDQKERYAVLSISVERVRVFEAFLGQIAEVTDYEREADSDDWQPYRHARRSPAVGAGVAARGGADVDRFEDRLREATARLYRKLMPELEKALQAEGVDRIILSGTPEPMAAFKEALSPGLQRRLAGEMPPPADPDADAGAWLPDVRRLIDQIETQHELALIAEVRESGVVGLHETLMLLQEHRLHTLIAPWVLDQRVYRAEDGRVALSAEEAAVLSPDQEVTEVSLIKILPTLVADSGTELEFVAGEAEERLNSELGRLAGLKRY